MWTGFVEADHEETDSVRSTSILLSVDLCLLMDSLEDSVVVKYMGLLLSATEETKRLAGIGRL